jgi:hypothetical protein
MTMLTELRRALAAARDELINLVDDEAAFAAKEAEIEADPGQDRRAERAQEASPRRRHQCRSSEHGPAWTARGCRSGVTLVRLAKQARAYGVREGPLDRI